MAFHDILTSFNDGLRQLASNHLPPSLISPRSLHKGLARLTTSYVELNYLLISTNKQYYGFATTKQMNECKTND